MDYEPIHTSFQLSGKVAIITGSASGIGYAIAEMFAKNGANLFMIDLMQEINEISRELAVKYGVKSIGYSCNLSEDNFVTPALDRCFEVFDRVDILVNNAGVNYLDDVEDLSKEKWQKTLDINLTAPFLLSQGVAKTMIQNNGGKIINIASQASVVALDKHAAYCVSKAGIVSLTKICALEWAEFNINVNCISPTVILTEMGRNYWKGELGEAMKKQIPMGRFGYPEEVAAACAFLASNASNLITGENIILDGGYTIK